MARIAGRKGRVYIGINPSDSASPLPFVAKWALSFATAKFDVTAMGDSNKSYVSGLADASGDFSGFFDDASNQTYVAATDGQARNFYLYADATKGTSGTYFFGQVIADYSIDGDVAGAVTLKATWDAASLISKVN